MTEVHRLVERPSVIAESAFPTGDRPLAIGFQTALLTD